MQEPPGIYVNPVLGWRTWKLDPLYGTLGAVGVGGRWPPHRALVSQHNSLSYSRPRDCEPGVPCTTCGIYALDSYRSVEEHQQRQRGSNLARGVVAGWGVVRLCSRGWRAGKAYPLALLDWQVAPKLIEPGGNYWHTVLHLVAERYGIPVVATVEELEAVGRAAGAVPLSEW